MKYTLLIFSLLLISTTCAIAQAGKRLKLPNLTIDYKTVYVLKLDVDTDEVVDEWTNMNRCIYSVDSKSQTISYQEFNQNKLINSWEYFVKDVYEDEQTYSLEAQKIDGTVTIVLWKDGRMVAIEGSDNTFLISEINKLE